VLPKKIIATITMSFMLKKRKNLKPVKLKKVMKMRNNMRLKKHKNNPNRKKTIP